MTGESFCVQSIKQNLNQMKFLLYSDCLARAEKTHFHEENLALMHLVLIMMFSEEN